ncbi:hypothetical protein DY000_02039508 [Brassica cretica]|uniref:Uncharacterized protein n=1 Tax=Brassica cretica TaxID=69181 RepID=A0ABQ7BSR7_BRACR|nr:hypothetical protein DY000_02039508 [Brassica cretica]
MTRSMFPDGRPEVLEMNSIALDQKPKNTDAPIGYYYSKELSYRMKGSRPRFFCSVLNVGSSWRGVKYEVSLLQVRNYSPFMCFSHDNLRNKASRQLVIVMCQLLQKLGKQADTISGSRGGTPDSHMTSGSKSDVRVQNDLRVHKTPPGYKRPPGKKRRSTDPSRGIYIDRNLPKGGPSGPKGLRPKTSGFEEGIHSTAFGFLDKTLTSLRTRQTNRAVYRLRTSGLELRPDPQPDDRTDRTEARISRPTRQGKANGQARITLGQANSDSDHSFSLLARLARTIFTGDCADDLTSLFDPIMDFSFGYFYKARILKLVEDMGHVGTKLVRSERPAAFAKCPSALADRPAHVLILSALDTASSDESGQEPNGHLD